MTDAVLAWQNGEAHTFSADEWATICASFLGFGFRIDLPAGADRGEAATYELGRLHQIAALLGASVVEADWELAASSHPEVDVELVGGWPRSYSGASAWWVAVVAAPAPELITTATLIETPLQPRPSSGLPVFSRLAAAAALASVSADCGVWSDAEGLVVTSTAGPVIAQCADGHWAMGTESYSWLARREAVAREARPDLCVTDLESVRFLGLIERARALQPLRYRRPTT